MSDKVAIISIRVGCAGWSLSKDLVERLGGEGSHLEMYSSRFNAVEINSTFYRSHRQSTYARWSETVPEDFRFSAKVPKLITHQKRLQNTSDDLTTFMADVKALGDKLEVLLIQLPPTLKCDPEIATTFFEEFRSHTRLRAVCEPRHESWFNAKADQLLKDYQIARVAADPAIVPEAATPGGWDEYTYYRLHGSPQKYYSAYDASCLAQLSKRLQDRSESADVWCIFDNTASGAAIDNADALSKQLTLPNA
jgi:uncharacterized protein YecE (DUF72 family)